MQKDDNVQGGLIYTEHTKSVIHSSWFHGA